MEEHVTLVQPDASPTGGSRHVTLPADLLEQVRGRVRLLALLLLVTFSFDPVLHFIALVVVLLAGQPIPPDATVYIGFTLADIAVAVASAGLWWIAISSRRTSSSVATARITTS